MQESRLSRYWDLGDGQTYAGGGEQEVELKDGKQIQIHLVSIRSYAKAIDVEVLVNLEFLQPGSRPCICRRFKTAVANYASKASEIALDYQRAGALIDATIQKMTREIVIRLMIRIEDDLTNALVDVRKAAVSG